MLYKYVKCLAVMLAGGACCSALAQNLLTNPGFEDATTAPWTAWDMYNYHNFGLDTSYPYAGTNAARFSTWGPWWSYWNAGGIAQRVASPTPTPPGYRLSAWVKDNSSGQSGINNFVLSVEFRDSADNRLGQIQQTFNIPGDGSYHFVTADLVTNIPPATATNLVTLVDPRWYSDVLIDNVSLSALPVPAPVITNITLAGGNVVLCGTNGTPLAYYSMLQTTNPALPMTNWTALAQRQFDTNGNFNCTNATVAGAQQSFYRITYASVITLNPATLPDGKVGDEYGVWWTDGTYWYLSPQYIGAGGGTPPYTFAVTAGTLPAGLTLSTNGLLSGTNTVSGLSTFTVSATDANARTGSQSYSLTVQP